MRERLLVLLTVGNLSILAFTLAERRVVEAQGHPPPVVRAQALEIVDTQGRVRASIGIMPPASNGAAPGMRETVLLRLMTERGRPAIKISASEEGAGFMAAGPTGTQNTYVSIGSQGTTASIRLRNENGREQTLAPE
jgi:hypothetical protein